ncbi:MAG: DUF2130 domain-containing protein [Candidatus Levybacteria bacterium]|nr:DUF2130 domain-containing protein [Candidatus Levybacteria bacterium]
MDQIKCKNCGQTVDIDEAMRHKYEGILRKEAEEKAQLKIEKEKNEAIALARKNALEEAESKNKSQREELKKEKEEKIEWEKKFKLAEEQRIKEQERIKEEARKEAEKKAEDSVELKLKAKDIQLEQYQKSAEAFRKEAEGLKRKLEQGSQQLQGEALELNLEEKLKAAFPNDEFIPVAKGKEGGDLIQNVRNKFGNVGSIIIWEFKRTKSWDKKWLPKLREDARTSNANEAVIVTEVLPEGLKVYEKIDGVWVTDRTYALHLAKLLREMGLRIAIAKSSAQHNDESLKKLHDYILSEDFRHKIEGEIERQQLTIKLLEDRHKADEKYYRLQKQNLESLSDNTSQIYFNLQKRLPSLPSIAGFEPEIVTGDEIENETLL